jgi:hypothetical protein
MKHTITYALAALLGLTVSQAQADSNRPIVLELFTSQGCSSCPPADALLRSLAKDPNILPLSMHVIYWDYLGWKDPFASNANTSRQRDYVQILKARGMFTPQMIVDGRFSVVGSSRGEITQALEKSNDGKISVPIEVKHDDAHHQMQVHIAAMSDASLPAQATLYAMHFKRDASTQVTAGENNGETLTSINNVTKIETLGSWKQQDADYTLTMGSAPDEGLALILQSDVQGKVIGALRVK